MSEPLQSGTAVRQAVRAGRFRGLTTGHAPGFTQANLVVLPWAWAADLVGFCKTNPFATPFMACSRPGDPALPELGEGIDVRTDLPGYLIHVNGRSTPITDLQAVWRDDLVAIAIGCWFSAEAALEAAGIRLRHKELGIQGPLFRTTWQAVPFGRLHGPLVVSMRPFQATDVARVITITAGQPRAHGAPLHQGDPATLGILRTKAPDWGEPLACEPDEVPLYWGCGLTALAALLGCGVPWFATHAPGRMLVTDRQDCAA